MLSECTLNSGIIEAEMKTRLNTFQNSVWKFYRIHKREMPWRTDISEYAVFVSEVMLQQTQVPRVIQKYPQFIESFSDFASLAIAPVHKLLSVWQGMGYNRRALYLKKSAQIIHSQYNDSLPSTVEELDKLPGIGLATAGSICAFAHNMPTVFIETNIRRVFLHHFFFDAQDVDDSEIFPLVEKTVSKDNAREWYWALMDYGSYLAKTQTINPNTKSKSYKKQSVFKGSQREMRGRIIKELLKKRKTYQELCLSFNGDSRFEPSLSQLIREGFVQHSEEYYEIINRHES